MIRIFTKYYFEKQDRNCFKSSYCLLMNNLSSLISCSVKFNIYIYIYICLCLTLHCQLALMLLLQTPFSIIEIEVCCYLDALVGCRLPSSWACSQR